MHNEVLASEPAMYDGKSQCDDARSGRHICGMILLDAELLQVQDYETTYWPKDS